MSSEVGLLGALLGGVLLLLSPCSAIFLPSVGSSSLRWVMRVGTWHVNGLPATVHVDGLRGPGRLN